MCTQYIHRIVWVCFLQPVPIEFRLLKPFVNEIKSGRYKNLMTKFMLHIKMKFYIQTASTLDLHYCHFHQSISIANEDFFMNSKFSSIKSHDVMFCTKYLIQVFFPSSSSSFPFQKEAVVTLSLFLLLLPLLFAWNSSIKLQYFKWWDFFATLNH